MLCIYHNYVTAEIKPTTIHSKVQLQDHNNIVDDTILMVGGRQSFTTPDGSIFPLTMKNGLCYLEQRKPTAWEMKNPPQQLMTSIEEWDPSNFKNDTPSTTMDQLPQLISKTVNAFSTNIDETNRPNSDKELTSDHYPDDVRSATFAHPEKITITDGNTGDIISKISLNSTDRVTLHNI